MRWKRAVQRRPHQLGHAGVDDREVARRRARLHVDDAREQHAGRPDDRAARLDDDRQARRAGPRRRAPPRSRRPTAPVRRRTRCRGRRRRRRTRARARPPAPGAAKPASRAAAAPQRVERGDLRADVHVDGDQLERGPRRPAPRAGARASSSGTPNLLIFRPVEMCGMALRVDVRVDADRDARDRPAARRSPRRAPARRPTRR